MNDRFLINPNLPENKVTTVYAHIDDNKLENIFKELSIKVIPVISQHADILCNYVGKSNFLVDNNQNKLCKFIEYNNGKSVIIENIKSPYPNDCLLNFADIGDYIICNKTILTEQIVELLPNKPIIDVKQGYSKCSVCICGYNTIITDDISIYNAVLQYDNINSLLIEKGSVHINKYDYGFIGGCCGLIDKNTRLFTNFGNRLRNLSVKNEEQRFSAGQPACGSHLPLWQNRVELWLSKMQNL